jgi:hypothetical protein
MVGQRIGYVRVSTLDKTRQANSKVRHRSQLSRERNGHSYWIECEADTRAGKMMHLMQYAASTGYW